MPGGFLNSIITVSIEGRTIAFDGDGPYLREDLERLAAKLGAFGDNGGLAWDAIDWLVIGRQGYDENELATSVEYGDLENFSQEDYLGVILFGRTSSSRNDQDSGRKSHPGMDFVDLCLGQRHAGQIETTAQEEPGLSPPTTTAGTAPSSDIQEQVVSPDLVGRFEWPDFLGGSSDEPLDSTDEWQLESDLKRLGYSVARGVSLDQRHSHTPSRSRMSRPGEGREPPRLAYPTSRREPACAERRIELGAGPELAEDSIH